MASHRVRWEGGGRSTIHNDDDDGNDDNDDDDDDGFYCMQCRKAKYFTGGKDKLTYRSGSIGVVSVLSKEYEG
jgi:hypothetical protein